jgi:AcrR family transcriptional regulator
MKRRGTGTTVIELEGAPAPPSTTRLVERSDLRRIPRQARGRQTVEALVAAVSRILVAEGPPALTTKRIAAEAGVGSGTLYHYFPNRAALFAAWEERFHVECVADVMAAVQRAQPLVREPRTIYRVAHAAVDAIARRSLAYRLDSASSPFLNARPAHRRDAEERGAHFLAHMLKAHEARIDIRDPLTTTRLLVTIGTHLTMALVIRRPELLISGEYQHAVAALTTLHLSRTIRPEDLAAIEPVPIPIAPRGASSVPEDERQPRKAPSQTRSEDTVATLLEATGRLVARSGLAAVTTKRVAETAGVSVGSVYQYFPTRDAMVAAWEEALFEELLDAFRAWSEAFVPDSTRPTCFHELVHRALSLFVERAPRYRQGDGGRNILSRLAVRTRFAERAADLVVAVMQKLHLRGTHRDARLAALFAVELAMKMTFSWVEEHPEACASGAFQREVATMITRYLLLDPHADARAR